MTRRPLGQDKNVRSACPNGLLVAYNVGRLRYDAAFRVISLQTSGRAEYIRLSANGAHPCGDPVGHRRHRRL